MLTVFISLLIAVFVIIVVVKSIKNKRNGVCSCGGDCSCCQSGCSHNPQD